MGPTWIGKEIQGLPYKSAFISYHEWEYIVLGTLPHKNVGQILLIYSHTKMHSHNILMLLSLIQHPNTCLLYTGMGSLSC